MASDRIDHILHIEELVCSYWPPVLNIKFFPLHYPFFDLFQALRTSVLRSECKMDKSSDAKTDIDNSSDAGIHHISDELVIVNHGTELDQKDMARMGKGQVFKVWPYLQILKLILMLFSVPSVTIQYSHFP